jgi:hypothetical protein
LRFPLQPHYPSFFRQSPYLPRPGSGKRPHRTFDHPQGLAKTMGYERESLSHAVWNVLRKIQDKAGGSTPKPKIPLKRTGKFRTETATDTGTVR